MNSRSSNNGSDSGDGNNSGDERGGDLPRVWPRNLAYAAGAAALAFAVMRFLQPGGEDGAPAATPAPAPSASTASPAAVASAGASPALAPIALEEAYPSQVKAGGIVYTRVGSKTLTTCTSPDSVGPRLIALVKQGHGCLNHQIALYKDERSNQYNLSVFTFNDPADTAHVLTRLAADATDYQVGAQAPPPGAGLPVLPADSGMVQAFAGAGRAMIVGLGQWSDGHTTDYQRLTDRLSPLLDAVSTKTLAHETGKPPAPAI
ncbi:hypothetical protein PUR71_03010 [Streptomyces sp. SP17BM10]|uniref:hypothetical protein n=1 Tax=Streptomyces sp. SP17BM10 TaxID=3002530 RepID=UPI002E7754CB|nr:hypothetical protein [Streptomyces sp. SP17BM10]MEE1781904.1 hypothetical protein [Streptomyces sp. SP17BM10]